MSSELQSSHRRSRCRRNNGGATDRSFRRQTQLLGIASVPVACHDALPIAVAMLAAAAVPSVVEPGFVDEQNPSNCR